MISDTDFIFRVAAGLDDFEDFHVFHGYPDSIVYSVVKTASELLGKPFCFDEQTMFKSQLQIAAFVLRHAVT